jgi:3-hydroxyacyl-[acyl-carrier-protein] dehydratase
VNVEEKEALIQQLKRQAIELPVEGSTSLRYGISEIQKIIPHRKPFLLIDSLLTLNLKQRIVEAERKLDPADPVFEGHFPGQPVYPGVLQVEAMGQAGLCLAYFVKNDTLKINDQSKPVVGLFTRIHNAGFNFGLYPGDTFRIRVRSVEDDEFMGFMSAQILVGNKIHSHSLLEVYYQ